jgi:hypothetical protein
MPEFRITPAPYDPDEDEIKIAPPETGSFPRAPSPSIFDPEPEPRHLPGTGTPLRFSLQELFFVLTAVGIWLGTLRLLMAFNRPYLLVGLGLLALVGMYKWSYDDGAPGIMRLIWWGMLLGYLSMVAWTLW